MDYEKEINSLAAETIAMTFVVGSVLSKLALNPILRQAITEAFDQSARTWLIVSLSSMANLPLPSIRSKLSALSRKCVPWFLAMRASLATAFSLVGLYIAGPWIG